ncbi:MAG: hypothetical protein E4H40_06825 [Candidatus Brocadiia bacterium]|nr:MAG: hypothetical protein E4H40_06825 [Candidatus Brocadiia bacterium]
MSQPPHRNIRLGIGEHEQHCKFMIRAVVSSIDLQTQVQGYGVTDPDMTAQSRLAWSFRQVEDNAVKWCGALVFPVPGRAEFSINIGTTAQLTLIFNTVKADNSF